MFSKIELYADLPMYIHQADSQLILDVANLLTNYHYTGSLLFFNHDTLDPCLIASHVLYATKGHIPLIAIQPNVMPPTTAAKMIKTLSFIHKKQIDINLITGGSVKDMESVCDNVDKEHRFLRLKEYAYILRSLLESNDPFTFDGIYYKLKNVIINAAIKTKEHRPRIWIAINVDLQNYKKVKKIADIIVTQAKPVSQFEDFFLKYNSDNNKCEIGIRIGLIARETAEEAKNISKEKLEYRFLQILKSKFKMSGLYTDEDEDIFFPTSGPNNKTNCPVLVGDYNSVAAYFEKYIKLGIHYFIIGNIESREDLDHCNEVFKRITYGKIVI